MATPSSTQKLQQLDKQYLWHPFTHMQHWLADDPLVITDAEGCELIDSDGNRYLDGTSSLWCNVHGHRVPEIDAAIVDQLGKVAHTTMLGLASEPASLLGEKLIDVVPDSLAKVFYSDAGATAAEVAFKLAVQYWHNVGDGLRTEFIALSQAYHGDTLGAVSVGRMEAFHAPYMPLLFPVHYAPTPHTYRSEWPDNPLLVSDHCLNAMRALLDEHAEKIAAICVEPTVQGAAGIITHPRGFLNGVAGLAHEYGVLLICDEVATGFGRTGKMFACEHEDVKPDLMCVGKGITGGYLPLAATFASQRIFDAFLGDPWEGKTFFHGHTYTGNPLACRAALASLELFDQGLLEALPQKCCDFASELEQLRGLPHVGDIRQMGMMAGVELVEDVATRKPFDARLRMGAEICLRARKHGVIMRPLGDVVIVMPPLAMAADARGRLVSALATELRELRGSKQR